jgi:hypothetical protein
MEAGVTRKFIGGYRRLKIYASLVDPQGEWRSLVYSCKQYRTKKGAVLNYWKKSKKITFQGDPTIARQFQCAFLSIAADKGFLIDNEDKDLRTLQLENEALQRSLVKALRDNRRLRKMQ